MQEYNFNPNLFIIDNFYNDPDSIRKIALSCEYMESKHDSHNFRFGNAPWPGQVSKNNYSPKNIDYTISKFFNKQLRQLPNINSGRFRLSSAEDKQSNVVHLDTCTYAGVLYLNPNMHDTPGTIFYTHKDTQTTYGTQQLFNELFDKKHINDLSYWDINLISYIVYNRMIIYPANIFHGIGPLFGNSLKDSRLVQLFFWEAI